MTEGRTLGRDDILGAVEKRAKDTETIPVPEWGGDIRVKLMNADDVERSGLADGKRDASMFPKIIAACVVDEDANPLFSEADVATLAKTDMVVAAKVFAEIMRVNGLMDEELEEAVRSFAQAPSDGSSSA